MPDDGRYPWGGELFTGSDDSPAAVATLGASPEVPSELAAVWGPLRTENIGIETLVANILSNPRIRFLVLFGEDVRGHLSGASLLALHRNGVDERRRIVGAPGAVPFIENIGDDAIERFGQQVEVVDLRGCTDTAELARVLEECIARDPGPMEGPFMITKLRCAREGPSLTGGMRLHATVVADPYGEVRQAEVSKGC